MKLIIYFWCGFLLACIVGAFNLEILKGLARGNIVMAVLFLCFVIICVPIIFDMGKSYEKKKHEKLMLKKVKPWQL